MNALFGVSRSNIIFAELHWTPGVLAQAEDRCHRIGQKSSVNVMYCICKDEEVSVDMSLWSMLGRKVGNLGRVVDGERGKGLNAVERDAGASSPDGGDANAVSVEEELSSFFASSTVSSSGKPGKGPVVKGTIQSFFGKQAKKLSTKKSSAKTSEFEAEGVSLVNKENAPNLKAACISLLDNGTAKKIGGTTKKSRFFTKEKTPEAKLTCISLLDDDDCDEGNDISAIEAKPMRKRARPESVAKITAFTVGEAKQTRKRTRPETATESTTFACHACTFENKAGETACAMCGTPRIVTARPSEQVQSEALQSTREWSCSFCTYVNQNEATHCDICREERQLKSSERDDNAEKSHSSSQSSNNTCEGIEFEEDNEWNEEDLAAIGRMTQSYTQLSQSAPQSASKSVSQSPSSDTPPSNPQKESMSRKCNFKKTPCKSDISDIFSFSVSRNSGRIALHLSSTGQPLHVNFDISQVLTNESADRLEDINLSRQVSSTAFSQSEPELSFDDRAIRQVLSATCDNPSISVLPLSQENMQSICLEEVKTFVRSYCHIREVEKKAIKESGEAIPASYLKQTVAKLLVSTVTGTTERYLGGAKERAILNSKNNCATSVDHAVLSGQACAWCAKPFICSNGATYCSQSCAEEGRLRRGGMYASTRIREQLFSIEHGVCTKCGIDAHQLFNKMKALHPAERLNALLNAKWKLPQTRQATERLLNEPKESDFWQADHEVAVAEGGGSTGLDNIRTLCTPCHSTETEKLFARLKTMPASQLDGPTNDGMTQMDIISCFSKMKEDEGSGKSKRRKRRRAAD